MRLPVAWSQRCRHLLWICCIGLACGCWWGFPQPALAVVMSRHQHDAIEALPRVEVVAQTDAVESTQPLHSASQRQDLSKNMDVVKAAEHSVPNSQHNSGRETSGADLPMPAFAPGMTSDSSESAASVETKQPLNTYVFFVPAEGVKHKISLHPPATKLRIKSDATVTALLCGDAIQTYHCSGGKPLRIERANDEAISQFMARNLSDRDVRLRIEVYGVSDLNSEAI